MCGQGHRQEEKEKYYFLISILKNSWRKRARSFKPENTHTVRLTSCLTRLDSTKQVNLTLIQHKQCN